MHATPVIVSCMKPPAAAAAVERPVAMLRVPRASGPMLDSWLASLTARLRADSSSRLLLALDFDGTLAPIVSDPATARPIPAAAAALERLCALAPRCCVAVISGRQVATLREFLPLPAHAIYAGAHGLDITCADAALRERVALDTGAAYRPALAAARDHAQAIIASDPRFAGASVEDNLYSITVHYRNLKAPEHTAALLESVAAFVSSPAAASQLQLRPGKLVCEYRPAAPLHKGSALRHLLTALGMTPERDSLLVAGDDLTDEDMYAAGDAWAGLHGRAAGMNVFVAGRQLGDADDTVDVGRPTRAHVAVDTPADMADLLTRLERAVCHRVCGTIGGRR